MSEALAPFAPMGTRFRFTNTEQIMVDLLGPAAIARVIALSKSSGARAAAAYLQDRFPQVSSKEILRLAEKLGECDVDCSEASD